MFSTIPADYSKYNIKPAVTLKKASYACFKLNPGIMIKKQICSYLLS